MAISSIIVRDAHITNNIFPLYRKTIQENYKMEVELTETQKEYITGKICAQNSPLIGMDFKKIAEAVIYKFDSHIEDLSEDLIKKILYFQRNLSILADERSKILFSDNRKLGYSEFKLLIASYLACEAEIKSIISVLEDSINFDSGSH
jgi:hypothetical protein